MAAERAAKLPESSKGVAAPPQPEQQHESSARAASAPGQASSRQHTESSGWQPPGSAKVEQHGASNADVEDTCSERCQGSHRKRPLPDKWQPVTASQILKRQRVADTAPQLSREPQKSAATCQTVQPEQSSLSLHCTSGGATGPDILLQPSKQEVCHDCGPLLDHTAAPGQHMDSEESCEDVLAMWGEAGEPEQEFAWAEPPAGMGNGDTEGNSASAGQAASMVGQRTWACQVCIRACVCTSSLQ